LKILVTGSGGLIGSEASEYFLKLNHNVVGIDNNMRMIFFGTGGDVRPTIKRLKKYKNYEHANIDITNRDLVDQVVSKFRPDAIIHCAAQPSHDKAADIPYLDFNVNANGTLNLLEAFRRSCTNNSVFIHVSTNKVYGDRPNYLDLVESEKRYDFASKEYEDGISENLSIDNCMHSLFGASKVAGDILAQEYGKYFNLNVGVFRGGCLTGPQHAGVELHGFLSYIIKCALLGNPYTIFGYKGKQVRDQIHCYDVISAFESFIKNPKKGEVYNIGGGKSNSASILEVIEMIQDISGKSLDYSYSENARAGDHICYYTDMTKFKKDFPEWNIKHSIRDIIREIVDLKK
jgi:CDP-paratose 2-epimerase